ncbi:MAG: hypothetical protein IPJ74_05810 [Saprospiraceae bacterium]|nr:hypothetical protein [Saprospiraceae bacterium]
MPRAPIYKSCYSKRLERAKDDRLLKELSEARECTEKRIPNFVENQLSRVIESSSTSKTQRGNIIFVIEADGSVTVQKIDSSFDKDFAEKAKKAIEGLPKFIPGQDAKGNSTRVLYILPITLKGQ